MEALSRWWRERLSRRERRALVLLAVVAPAIVLWFGVTRPLLDRRDALERAGRVLEQRARELEPLLRRAVELDRQGIGFPEAEPEPLPLLEADLDRREAGDPMPALIPCDIMMGTKKFPGARIRVEGWRAGPLWRMVSRVTTTGWLVSDFEVSRSGEKPGLDGFLSLWRKKGPNP